MAACGDLWLTKLAEVLAEVVVAEEWSREAHCWAGRAGQQLREAEVSGDKETEQGLVSPTP